MKKLIYIFMFPLMLAASSMLKAQNYAEGSLGLPGDNLNLFAVMKLFQESETLEGFERNLNDENSRINNLDLNGDNRTDYIRVIDKPDGDLHMIVLQVAINIRENQDVAVFIVQREANNQVRIQLIGDEALYGRNYIIEPNYSEYAGETANPGYVGTTTIVDGQTVVVNRVTTHEVAAWPLIRFIFLPGYITWHSPWYWDYYPTWWHSWSPFYWHYYYGYHYNWYPRYYGYYRYSHHYNHPYWHDQYYGSRRTYSPYVATHIHNGYYKNTYSRPESRRAGSELYARTYKTDDRRMATRTLGNSQSGRTSARSGGNTTYARRDISTSASRRQLEATTGRTSAKSATSRPAARTETRRTSSDSKFSSSTSRKQTEAVAGRPSTKSATARPNVQTENRRSVTGSRAGSSPERKSTTNTQVKSRTRGSSVAGKSRETVKKTSSGRR